MAKKTSPAKKQPAAIAVTPPKRSAKSTPAKKPVKKKAIASAVKASPAKKSASKPAAKNSATKSTIKLATVKMPKKSRAAQPADGYLATLNDWRQSAVATVRRIAVRKRSQQPAAKTAARKAPAKATATQAVNESHGPLAWIKSHAQPASGLWHRVPDPRKLLQDTGAKLRHVNLASLTSAGKKELQELVHLAGKLSEISASPSRPAKGRAKRK
jgi:hypothetical protein